MGQAVSYNLNQFEVDELVALTNGCFTQEEIEALYKRFRTLDRGRKGFITADEFLSIPELSINPLAKRLAFFYDGINFREFVKMLAPYSPKATKEDKLKHLFAIWDVDGDGVISKEDMELIVRQSAGSSLSESEVHGLVDKVRSHAGVKDGEGLGYPEFRAALDGFSIGLSVDVPVEW